MTTFEKDVVDQANEIIGGIEEVLGVDKYLNVAVGMAAQQVLLSALERSSADYYEAKVLLDQIYFSLSNNLRKYWNIAQ